MAVRISWVSLFPLLALGACTVGKDHVRPTVVGADGAWSTAQAAGAVDLEPWRALGDPVLIGLIEDACRANLDIAAAQARLNEARAMRDAVAGGTRPSVAAAASGQQRRLSRNGEFPFNRLPGLENEFPLYDAGFDAAWEIDLWGGRRRATEGATATIAARRAAVEETRLQIVAETVRAYSRLREAQAFAQILSRQADVDDRTIRIARNLADAGETTRDGLHEAQAMWHRTQAELAEARANATEAANVVAVLIAQPPETMAARLTPTEASPTMPTPVSVGLRSDILQRRPDIAIAEAKLAAATADVGVARAQLFPQLSLLGGIGLQSRTGDSLIGGDSLRFGIGPSLRWPILSGGRIRAQIRGADARVDAAAADYEKAVLVALADSETRINRYNASLGKALALGRAEQEGVETVRDARRRFDAGEDGMMPMLAAQTRANAAALAARAAKTDAIIAYAMLSKALGGGYDPARSGH